MRRFILLVSLCGLLLALLTGSSFAEDVQQKETIVRIIYTDEQLVILVNLGKEGFQGFLLKWISNIYSSNNNSTTNLQIERLLSDYNNFQVINNGTFPKTGTVCLVLEKENRGEPYPTSCLGSLILSQKIHSSDVFWWDNAIQQTKTFIISTDNISINICPGGADSNGYGECIFDDYNPDDIKAISATRDQTSTDSIRNLATTKTKS